VYTLFPHKVRRARRQFTLIESGRVLTMSRVVRTTLGMATYCSLVSGAVVFMSMDFRRAQTESGIDAVIPTYIAPERKIARAAQERLTFVGIKGVMEPIADDGPPSPLSTAVIANAGDSEVAEVPQFASSALEEIALSEIQVDSAVTTDPTSGGPEYPPGLLLARVEGEVLARFIVDSLGRADPASFIAVQASDTAFTSAVRRALPLMKFRPALLRGVPVPQVVVQSFAFRIAVAPKDTTGSVQPLPGRGQR